MDSILKKYSQGDAVLWAVFFFLCFISVVEMFSASSTLAFSSQPYCPCYASHFILGVGAGIAFLVHLIPARYIRFGALC